MMLLPMLGPLEEDWLAVIVSRLPLLMMGKGGRVGPPLRTLHLYSHH